MSLSLSDEQTVRAAEPGVSSLASLIERGLSCARQGLYAESASLFALAREQLQPDREDLVTALEAAIQSHNFAWQTQQSLLEASKRFAEAVGMQQAHQAALEQLLPTCLCPGTSITLILP